MYKFRSMKINAEKEKAELLKQNERKDWPLFKIENDPRITRLWVFLRKYDIDELPQLWNVFIWDMSLIWPRPHLPEEVALYKDYQKRVLTLKPGITWMAQSHWRHKNSFDDEVKLDIFYIENWSFLLDLKILFKTVKVVIKKEWR
jgi:lipopolysaccharide/colanic/teichoic acid biosynthesis glycosyltransferase